MSAEDDSELKRRFGLKVRERRNSLGLTQDELAAACELDRTYIGGVERGERNVSLPNIHKIAKALGVAPGTLLDD